MRVRIGERGILYADEIFSCVRHRGSGPFSSEHFYVSFARRSPWKMSMDDYYKINHILLKGLGLWPYQDPKRARILMVVISSVFLSTIFAQVF